MVNKGRQPRDRLRNLRLGIGRRMLRSGLALNLVRRAMAGQTTSAKAHEQASARFAFDLAEKAYVDKNGKVIWINAFFPSEIVWGMGLVPFHPEIVSAVSAGVGLSQQGLAAAEAEGYPIDVCTFHRNIAGLQRIGLLPKMDAAISTSNLCDIAGQTLANLAFQENKPFYLVDVPQVMDNDTLAYVENQLRRVTEDICHICNVPYQEDRLKGAIRLSNTAWDHAKALAELRTSELAPLKGSAMLNQMAFLAATFGSEHAVTYYGALRDYVATLVEAHRSEQAVQNCRIYWMHLGPYYPAELFAHLEDTLGVAIAYEEDSNVWWPRLDEGRPFYSLAAKVLSHFCQGPVENRIRQILHDVSKYRIDGVIHWNHWGCRQSTGALRIIGDTLRNEGIPFLQLDGDCIDARNFQWGPMRTRVEGFLEMIA